MGHNNEPEKTMTAKEVIEKIESLRRITLNQLFKNERTDRNEPASPRK